MSGDAMRMTKVLYVTAGVFEAVVGIASIICDKSLNGITFLASAVLFFIFAIEESTT